MKAKPPTAPLEIRLVFLGDQATTIRKAADGCGMIAADYAKMLVLVCSDPKMQSKMRELVSPKKFEAIGAEGMKTANAIMRRSKLRVVKGGKK